jgi:Flp pilus assembly protein TadG
MRSLFKFLLRLARCSSGSALVEMTIIIPVAISLMAGGVDFGWWVSTQATGSKSVRDAARYLATLPTPINVCSNSTAVANAQSLAVYGKLGGVDGTDTPLVPGWQMNGGTNNNVTVSCSGSSVIVAAKFPFISIILTPLVPIASTYTLSAQHEEVQVGS